MTGPASSGVLFYAKDIDVLSAFYQQVLDAKVLHADKEHLVLQSPNVQLVIHAVPEPYRSAIDIQVPPVPREEQAIKPFFTVPSLQDAEMAVLRLGGELLGPVWPGPGFRVRNVCDPEGNILQLRDGAV